MSIDTDQIIAILYVWYVLQMYFEEREAGKLHKVDKDSMLQDLLKHKRYTA